MQDATPLFWSFSSLLVVTRTAASDRVGVLEHDLDKAPNSDSAPVAVQITPCALRAPLYQDCCANHL